MSDRAHSSANNSVSWLKSGAAQHYVGYADLRTQPTHPD